MERRLLIGTNNAGKREEILALVADLAFRIFTPREAGIEEEPKEGGKTFLENAAIKALFYASASGLPTLADDSGLIVDALGGGDRPGIHSARFAGPEATDADNRRKLLEELRGVPDPERTARFECAVALADPGGVRATAVGRCAGIIIRKETGEGGFGYDPLFFYPPEGATFAEIPREVKNRVSHRAKALEKIRGALEDL